MATTLSESAMALGAACQSATTAPVPKLAAGRVSRRGRTCYPLNLQDYLSAVGKLDWVAWQPCT